MKKIFLCMTFPIAALFYGCSDNGPEQVVEKEGVNTYMSVSINFPASGLRAAVDPNATEAEVDIKSVDIFIYGSDGRFLAHHPMQANLFTPVNGAEDRYESTQQIKTSTGPKIIYAGINLPATTLAVIDHQPMAQLANTPCTFTREELTTLTNGLPMFSMKGVSQTFVENPADPANHVRIDMKRMVAKITVDLSATMEKTGVPGDLGPIEVAVNNFNLKMFLEQGAEPHKDPNWTSGQYNPADFNDSPASAYQPVFDLGVNPSPSVDDYVPLYASENTSENKTKKEITRVTVRSTFMPDEVTVIDGGDYKQEPRPAAIDSPTTFYTVTGGIGDFTRYFYESSVAQQYATDKGGTLLTYNNGYCYWDMYLNKASGENQWDVLRNEYYKCTITRIVAPGKPSPDVKDPDTLPEADTHITADINILFWTPVLADYILEP